jgi:hypothetical protein
LNLICFALKNGNDATRALHHALNATGKMYCTHTIINDRYLIRMAIGATLTEERHIEAAWKLIQSKATIV